MIHGLLLFIPVGEERSVLYFVGKVVFWVVVTVWLFIGLCIMIMGLRRRDMGDMMDRNPVIMALICLIAGPIIFLIASISAAIECKNKRKNGPKSG